MVAYVVRENNVLTFESMNRKAKMVAYVVRVWIWSVMSAQVPIGTLFDLNLIQVCF